MSRKPCDGRLRLQSEFLRRRNRGTRLRGEFDVAIELGGFSWQRMIDAVEIVRERVRRAAKALVRMKLNSFRRKDQVHLLDLISLGLVDETWLTRLSPIHAERLQELLDDPNG